MVTGGWKDKASMTLMAGGSATGELTPPHFMFGGGGWPGNIAAAADAGSCVLVKPDSHMMTGQAFAELLPMMAGNIPGGVSPTNRCLLILDSHGSRTTEVFKAAAKRIGFDILILPGGTTFLLQPWDQCFASAKRHFITERDRFLEAHPLGTGIDRTQFVRLWTGALKAAFAATPDLLRNAFKKCGIWPFNPDVVLVPLRAAVAAAAACRAGATSAATPAPTARRVQAAVSAMLQLGSQSVGRRGTAAAAAAAEEAAVDTVDAALVVESAAQLMEQNGTVVGQQLAAALRRGAAPQRQPKAPKLEGWFNSMQYEADRAAKTAAREEKERGAAERKAARAAKRSAAAAAAAGVAERRAAALSQGKKPKGRPKVSVTTS